MIDKRKFNIKDFDTPLNTEATKSTILNKEGALEQEDLKEDGILDLIYNCEINSSHLQINNEHSANIREYNTNSCQNSDDDVLILNNTQKHNEKENIVIDNMIKGIVEQQVGTWIENNLSRIVERTVQKLITDKLSSMKNGTLDL